MLKIVVNINSTNPPLTGIGNFTMNILKIWEQDPAFQLRFFLNASFMKSYPSEAKPKRSQHVILASYYALRAKAPVLTTKIRNFLPILTQLKKRMDKRAFLAGFKTEHPDVYFEPCFIPYCYDIPTVIAVHDISHIRHPETHPADRRKFMNKYFAAALNQATAIVTVSEFTKRELVDYLQVPSKKIFVVGSGADPHFTPRTADETSVILNQLNLNYREYLLFVGTLEPRKNLHRLIQAYQLLPEQIRVRFPLVICGAKGWLESGIDNQTKRLVTNGQIRVLSYVKQQVLYELYSAARASCYVSIYEGFGLPVLESMQSGTPVITSNAASMPEVAGRAGLKVDPHNIEEISAAMQAILQNDSLWHEQRELGLQESKRYSWEKTAQLTKSAIEFACE